MQNIRAPYSESYSTYTNYYKSYTTQEEWNKAVYDFLIPIYSNMGGATSLDTSKNADATLKYLSITSCKLNPSFQSSAYTYDCYANEDVNEIKLEAVATNAKATVDYDETISLSEENASIEIVVTAAAGNVETYRINVHKIKTDGYSPSEVLNGVGIKTGDKYATNLELGADVSNIINSISNKYYFAKVKVMDASKNEITEGTVKTGTVISVNNAGTTSEYTAVLYGDTSGDGKIDIMDLLIVQKHLLKVKSLSGAYLESADINKDGKVDIIDLLLVQKYLLKQYTISQG